MGSHRNRVRDRRQFEHIEDASDPPTHWVECIRFNVGRLVSLAIAEEFGKDYARSLRC